MKGKVESINKILADRDASFRIEHQQIWRDNTEREGYVIRPLTEEKNACPILYRGSWYDGKTDDEICDWLCAAYSQYAMCIDTRAITDPDEILQKILPRVSSRENAEWMDRADVCHKEIMDGIVESCYLPIVMPDGQNGCVQVTNILLAVAGITPGEAFNAASDNMAATIEMTSMAEMLAEMLGVPAMEEPAGVPDMTVITNAERLYAGAALACQEQLHDMLIQRLGNESFLVIPSSIHELLIIPDVDMNGDLSKYADMVREVNDGEVAPDERLSYHVYGYQGGVLCVVA